MGTGEEYTSYLGQYPVIFMTLKPANSPHWKWQSKILLMKLKRSMIDIDMYWKIAALQMRIKNI